MATLSRRHFIGLAAAGSVGSALAACTPAPAAKPAAPPGPPAAAPAASGTSAAAAPEWERVLAAARQEGGLLVVGGPGPLYREWVQRFQNAYPALNVEFIGQSGRDFQPKLMAERRAEQYLPDVHFGGPGTIFGLHKEGVFDPIRPALLLPEVLDSSQWFGGLDESFTDLQRQYIFGFQGHYSPQVFVNRGVIPESELSAVEQLADPKWAGKIAWNDPRAQGAGNGRIAGWMAQGQEDFVRRLLQQGGPITTDLRQHAEWLVRGQYPIAVGVEGFDLVPFQQQGLGQNVLPLAPESALGGRLEAAFGNLALLNRAPHPNAARVFINWGLSREGQTAWVQIVERNSRRLDVPNDPQFTPKAGATYVTIDHEDTVRFRDDAAALAREILE